jgi:hypothetical protein
MADINEILDHKQKWDIKFIYKPFIVIFVTILILLFG